MLPVHACGRSECQQSMRSTAVGQPYYYSTAQHQAGPGEQNRASAPRKKAWPFSSSMPRLPAPALAATFSTPPCCEEQCQTVHTDAHAPNRLAGSARSSRLMTSAAAAGTSDGTRILPEAIRSKVKYSEAARKGALPTSIW